MRYFLRVGFDTGIGASQCVLTNAMKSLGKAGGIISSLAIGSVLNVINLFSTGDWVRFGLNSGATATSVLVGYGGAEGGAFIGTLICPGVGTIVGGLLGGLAGGFAGSWAFSRVTGSNQLTTQEK